MIIGNVLGFVMVFLSLGAASGIGLEAEGAMMMVAGSLLIAMDVVHRLWPRQRTLDRSGGTVCFMPAWTLGVLWFGFGCAYLLGLT
jgi:hypothetical protein